MDMRRWIRRGVLEKRAQGKSTVTRFNFRRRTFVLTDTHLSYYKGSALEELKLRGSIPLKTIRSCERCDGTVWSRPSLLQLVHDAAILYISAENSAQLADWMEDIRLACLLAHNKSSKHKMYHPGVFHHGRWTCCAITTPSGGCKAAFRYSEKSAEPQTTPLHLPETAPVRFLNDDDFVDAESDDPDEAADRRMQQLAVKPTSPESISYAVVDERDHRSDSANDSDDSDTHTAQGTSGGGVGQGDKDDQDDDEEEEEDAYARADEGSRSTSVKSSSSQAFTPRQRPRTTVQLQLDQDLQHELEDPNALYSIPHSQHRLTAQEMESNKRQSAPPGVVHTQPLYTPLNLAERTSPPKKTSAATAEHLYSHLNHERK